MSKQGGKVGFVSKDETAVVKGVYSNKDMTVSTDYATIYKNGVEKGFDVPYVRSYYNHSGKENMEMHIKTPYMCDDKPVYGHMVVTTDKTLRLHNDLRGYNTGEFYNDNPAFSTARNLSDVHPNGCVLKDKDGNEVDYADALDEMGVFASAASEYPHVVTYDEYVTLKTPVNARLNLPAPDEAAYGKYLEHCKGLMKDCEFIGDIRKVSNVDTRFTTTPSFNQEVSSRELPYDDTSYEMGDSQDEYQ